MASRLPTGSTPTDITAQFEQMWATFDRNYSYFDYKRIDWNALKAEFAPRVAGLTQNEFVLLVQIMLARLHDQHVVLTSDSTTLRTYTPDDFVNWDNSVWQQYLARGGAQAKPSRVAPSAPRRRRSRRDADDRGGLLGGPSVLRLARL